MRVRAVLAGIVALVAAGTGTAHAAPTLPSKDPFYAVPDNMGSVAPGTVLRTRKVSVSPVGGVPGVIPATQVLYRTTRQLGEASATVATIIRPPVSTGPTKLISYQTFYDGVGDVCRPSYTLQGGGSLGSTGVTLDAGFALDYLAQGYTIVTADYEGATDDYGAGRESGYGTLDAIRAAEAQLELDPKTTPVGLVGYSGGATASMWAAEEQPDYAPALNVVGTAAGGIPVDFWHNLDYIQGTSDWAGAIPAITVGLGRAYHLDFDKLFSDKGKQIFEEVSTGCLKATAYPGLKFADLVKPEFADWHHVPEIVDMFNGTIMGRSGTPTSPLYMEGGNKDGTGDGVMVAKDVQQLAHSYCDRGVPVRYQEVSGPDHIGAALVFEPAAIAWFAQRFAGAAPENGCDTIGAGNPLDPLPKPIVPVKPALHVALRGRIATLSATVKVTGVRVSIYRVRATRRALIARRVLIGSVGTKARRVTLPARTHRGSRYLLVVRGKSGAVVVKRSLAFSGR